MFELNEKIRDLTPMIRLPVPFPCGLDANESFLSLPDDVRQELGRSPRPSITAGTRTRWRRMCVRRLGRITG